MICFQIFFSRSFWHQRICDTTLGSQDIAMWRFLWRRGEDVQELGILVVGWHLRMDVARGCFSVLVDFCLFREKCARLFWLIGTHELLYMFAPSPAVPPNWNSPPHPPFPSTFYIIILIWTAFKFLSHVKAHMWGLNFICQPKPKNIPESGQAVWRNAVDG